MIHVKTTEYAYPIWSCCCIQSYTSREDEGGEDEGEYDDGWVILLISLLPGVLPLALTLPRLPLGSILASVSINWLLVVVVV
jgi:hypothetical protein